MIRSLLLFIIVMSCAMLVPADAQQPASYGFVYGRVELTNHKPAEESSDYLIDIQVKDSKTAHLERAVQSRLDVFGCKVPTTGPHAILVYITARGYSPDRTECTINPDEEHAIPMVRLKRATAKKPTVKSVESTLLHQAEILSAMDRQDLFQWNLAEYHLAWRNDPALTAALTQFETAHRFDSFMAKQYSRYQPLFRQMIASQQGQPVAISGRQLLEVAQTTTLADSLRVAAIQTLSFQPTLEPTVLSDFRTLLQSHTASPTDRLYRSVRAALARIGTRPEKEQIIKDTGSPDPEIATSALLAVKDANLADPAEDQALSYASRVALSRQDRTFQAPVALENWTVWNEGKLALGLTLQAITNTTAKDWFSVVEQSGEKVLQVDFPAGQDYGVLQFSVVQKGDPPTTINRSRFTELVVEMRSADENRNVDVGIKQAEPFDPRDQTKFKRTFTDISTEWQEYRIPLRGEAAQLSSHADDNQYERLSRLQIVAELAFGDKTRQTFYIRRIYYAR